MNFLKKYIDFYRKRQGQWFGLGFFRYLLKILLEVFEIKKKTFGLL